MAQPAAIHIRGLTELRAELRTAEAGLGRAMTSGLKKSADPVVVDAQARAPKGETHRFAPSIKAKAAAAGVQVGSALPQAPVLEYASKVTVKGSSKISAYVRSNTPQPSIGPAIEGNDEIVATTVAVFIDEFMDGVIHGG